jgi:predicted MPP superfamily phosphohydrolase
VTPFSDRAKRLADRITNRISVGRYALRRRTAPLRRWTRRLNPPPAVRRGFAVALLAVTGALIGLELGGTVHHDVGPLQAEFSVRPTFTGDARLQVPPLGTVTLDSHDGPLGLQANVSGLDQRRTQQLVEQPALIEPASEQAVDALGEAVTDAVVRAVWTSLLGAFLLSLLVLRNVRRAVAAMLLTAALLAGTGVASWATFDPNSVYQPKYEGLISQAPAVIGDARDIVSKFTTYRGELIRIVTNMGRVYTTLSSLPVYEPEPGTIRVLHISDLHLQPNAWPVVRSVAEQFRVDAVVDTGDITDWGSEPENSYVAEIGRLGVPYVFVRGNHDSPTTTAAVASQRNAVVLDNQVRKIGGLTYAGIADPRFVPDKRTGDQENRGGKAESDPEEEAGDTLAGTIASAGGDVDVIAVHNPLAAPSLVDAGPLILAGHTHKRQIKQMDANTLLMVQSSTGGAGFRGWQRDEPTPLGMSVLYFTADGNLTAFDDITVSGAGQASVSLQRTVIGIDKLHPGEQGPEDGSPSPSPSTPTPSAPSGPSPGGPGAPAPPPAEPPTRSPS